MNVLKDFNPQIYLYSSEALKHVELEDAVKILERFGSVKILTAKEFNDLQFDKLESIKLTAVKGNQTLDDALLKSWQRFLNSTLKKNKRSNISAFGCVFKLKAFLINIFKGESR